MAEEDLVSNGVDDSHGRLSLAIDTGRIELVRTSASKPDLSNLERKLTNTLTMNEIYLCGPDVDASPLYRLSRNRIFPGTMLKFLLDGFAKTEIINHWIEMLAMNKPDETMLMPTYVLRKIPPRQSEKSKFKEFGAKVFQKENTSKLERIIIPHKPLCTSSDHWISLVVHVHEKSKLLFEVFYVLCVIIITGLYAYVL